MTTAADMRNKNADELHAELLDLLREQFNLRMQQGSGQDPRPHLFKQVRRAIARVKTILNEKQRAGEAS